MIYFFLSLVALLSIVLFMRKQHKKDESFLSPNLRITMGQVDADSSMLLKPASGKLKSSIPFYLAIDTETACEVNKECYRQGTIPEELPVVQLAFGVLNKYGELLSEQSFILKRDCEVSKAATARHGIDSCMLAEGIEPTVAYRELEKQLNACQCVAAHNLWFHRNVLMADMQQYGISTDILASKPGFCTMLEGRRAIRSGAYPSLRALFSILYFGRPDTQVLFTDKSLRDIRLAAACLRKLLPS